MADKEANIYIVDVGSSTADCHNGRTESDLDYGMKYVWEKIGLALQANRKGLGLGVIALRHNETNNPLDSGEGYENIGMSSWRNWSCLCSVCIGSMLRDLGSNVRVFSPAIEELLC